MVVGVEVARQSKAMQQEAFIFPMQHKLKSQAQSLAVHLPLNQLQAGGAAFCRLVRSRACTPL